MVEQLRERKDGGEIERIAEAAGVATRALERVVERVSPGMTELHVAGMLEETLREEGSEAFPFATIVASGPRAALPHARSSTREIARGDFLLIDFGAVVGGYCADVTRTFCVGPASDEQREVYDIVKGANARAASTVQAGMRGRDADALARRYIVDRGRGEEFGHSLGHGIGLEVHEAPRLSSTSESVLPARAVVTIEPGIYRPGWGGVRIEDDVVLEPEGPRILTSFTRELVDIA
jgi:Xaa-Pro aminopeptidase